MIWRWSLDKLFLTSVWPPNELDLKYDLGINSNFNSRKDLVEIKISAMSHNLTHTVSLLNMIMTMLSIIWFLSIYQVLKIDWKSEMELVVPSRNVLYIKTLGWLCALGRSSWCTLLAPLISNIVRHVNLISDYYQNKVTRKRDELRILIPMTFSMRRCFTAN